MTDEKKETSKITFELDRELAIRLRIVALEQGRSVTAILREFAAWYVSKKGVRDG